MDNKEKRCCANCLNKYYWKKEETDCYDIKLYKCKERIKEVVDEFHIDYKCCKNFESKFTSQEENSSEEKDNNE